MNRKRYKLIVRQASQSQAERGAVDPIGCLGSETLVRVKQLPKEGNTSQKDTYSVHGLMFP